MLISKKAELVCWLFELGIQNGHGVTPSVPNEYPIVANPIPQSIDNADGSGEAEWKEGLWKRKCDGLLC